MGWPAKESLSLPRSTPALPVTDRALSTRERGRSRFPLREPIGHAPVDQFARTLGEREGNDPGASPCLKATDCAHNPKTSRAAPRVEVFAERRSSPGIAGGHKPGGSAVESMRSYREIALDRCPAQPYNVVVAGQYDRHAGLHEFPRRARLSAGTRPIVIELRTRLRVSIRQVNEAISTPFTAAST